MDAEGHKRLIEGFYEEVWAQGNVAFAQEVFADDYVRHDLRPTEATRRRRRTGAGRRTVPPRLPRPAAGESTSSSPKTTSSPPAGPPPAPTPAAGAGSRQPASTPNSRVSTSSASTTTAKSPRSGVTATTSASCNNSAPRSTPARRGASTSRRNDVSLKRPASCDNSPISSATESEAVNEPNPAPVPPPSPRYLTAAQTRRVYDRIGRIQDLQAVYEYRATTRCSRTPTSPMPTPSASSATAPAPSPSASSRLPPKPTPATRVSTSARTCTNSRSGASPAYADHVELRLGNALPRLPYPDASFDRFLATYVLDLLAPGDITRTLAGSPPRPRPRRPALPRQPHHRHNPPLPAPHPRLAVPRSLKQALVGGCRPIIISDHLDQTAWTLRHYQTLYYARHHFRRRHRRPRQMTKSCSLRSRAEAP